MAMFLNLGRTLSLLRDLRGLSQAQVAQEAGIGKSQLSKYENGKELPKLDSLEKVLSALSIGHFEFFYTLYLIDQRAAELAASPRAVDAARDGEPVTALAEVRLDSLYLPPLLKGHPLLAESTDRAFTRVFADMLVLYRRIFEQAVLTGATPSRELKSS
jgi:transcriptional regulator with XRE-family HTH domain